MHIWCTILILVPLILMTDIKYLQCIFIDKNILVPFICETIRGLNDVILHYFVPN